MWNEEEHWQLLWDDLREVIEELLERREEAGASEDGNDAPEQATAPHFLGALVLDQLANPTGKLETRRVIDGQQRLTTLQILLSAIRTIAEDLALEDQSSIAEKLMFNDRDLVEEADHRLKVWPIKPDRQAFKTVMRISGVGSSTAEAGDGAHSIEDCYRFFVEEFRAWSTAGPQRTEKRVAAAIDSLWSLVRLVPIDLETKDDPQVIFETLNARGTPLLAADLIKNFVFRKAQEEGEETEFLHERYWKDSDTEEWRTEVSQGRLERPRIDVFVMHWLTMRTGKQIRAQQLFPSFRNYLARNDLGAREVLADISTYAEVYAEFSEPYSESREGLFFHRLEVMDTTTPYPVLLWLYGQQQVPEPFRMRIIEVVESWLTRSLLFRLTTKNYNKIFLELLNNIKDSDPSNSDEVVVEFFRQRDGSSDIWPTDGQLTEAMRSQRYWAQINQRRLRMFFKATERELRSTGYSESLGVTGKLHIEHLLPRHWAHYWELPGEEHDEVERIRSDEMKHTVGNLTVLTEQLNSSKSNAPWEKNRKAIAEHTVLLLNRELLKRWYNKWNEETIEERSEWLAELASEVWPGPGSGYWNE